MSLLVGRNDIMELICKFKSHIVPQLHLTELKNNPDTEIDCICKRCNFKIKIKMDPDHANYYLISDYI